MNASTINKLTTESRGKYSFYAEQVATVMASAGLIFDEEVPEIEYIIRGCA